MNTYKNLFTKFIFTLSVVLLFFSMQAYCNNKVLIKKSPSNFNYFNYDTAMIKFEKGLTWAQVKEKAKKENKYIFVDGFTTWCGPCRVMAMNVFTQLKVANFFNKNFINVAVQFDVTKKDNAEVKKWYQDAKYLANTYKIDSYPTYLFFNPDGDFVHTIIGGNTDADVFITKAKAALSPASQYATLKQQYQAGKRDSAFLLHLINATQLANEGQSLPVFVNEYLATQKNLLTETNLKLIAVATTKTTDPGFKVLLNNPNKIDAVADNEKSLDIILRILFGEYVVPFIRTETTITNYGMGMVVYSGEIVKNVDWDKIEEKLALKYPKLSQQTIMASKPIYYQWQNDWLNYTQSVTAYIAAFPGKLRYDIINTYALTILKNCEDTACINSAIQWSEKTLFDKNIAPPYYLYTYSALLYKSGKKEQAIKFLEDTISTSAQPNKDLISLLKKMKNNEKAW